jgi:hypothetical protein
MTKIINTIMNNNINPRAEELGSKMCKQLPSWHFLRQVSVIFHIILYLCEVICSISIAGFMFNIYSVFTLDLIGFPHLIPEKHDIF